jgi:hypothetical protein
VSTGAGAAGDDLSPEVAELQRIAAGLRDPDATAETLRRLADEALAVSRRISERLPEALADPGDG